MNPFSLLHGIVFAAECFFGASLILGLAWLGARGRAAASRHLVWTGAFATLLLLPLLAVLVPPRVVYAYTVVVGTAHVALPAPAAAPVFGWPAFGCDDAVIVLFAVWLAGVAGLVLKGLAGAAGLVLLHRRSVPHIPERIDGEKFRGAQWQLRLRTAPGEFGPVTWGIFRPVVLLPKSSVRWPRERLTSVLLHEFAHVRRRDALARLIALAACAFYWPNPFVWAAAQRLRCDGEAAADDCVLTAGVKATAYAEHLVGLAREFGQRNYAGVALSMAERSTLKSRVQSILNPANPRSGVTKMDVLKMAALGVAMTAALALVRPSFAESVVLEDAAPSAPAALPAAAPAPPSVPSPMAAPAPAASPAPLAEFAPPAPPAPAAEPAPPANAKVTTHIRIQASKLTAAEKAAIRQAASAEARMAMAEAQKTIGEAHIEQQVAEAMRRVHVAIRDAGAKVRNIKVQARRQNGDIDIDIDVDAEGDDDPGK